MKPEEIPAPLRGHKAKCHCCRKFVEVITLPDLSSRMYFPKNKENDQHVTEWEWKNPAFSQINPYYYDIFFCPDCYYSDFRDEFLNPEINPSNKISVIREKFLEKMKDPKDLIAIFAKKVTPVKMDFEKAVYLHLLAILAQEILPGPGPQDNPRRNRDWKKLARLYLRTAWLFREENPEHSKGKKNEGSLFLLRVSINDMLKGVATIKTGLEGLIKNLEDQQNFEKEKKIYKRDIYLNYKANLQRVVSLFNQIKSSSVNLKEVNDGHMRIFKEKSPLMGASFYEFKDTLLHLTDIWPDIPTSEIDCLKRAADHFQLAADNDRYLSEIEGIRMLEFGIMLLSRARLKEELKNLYGVFMRRASDIRGVYMKKKAGTKSMVDQEMFNAEITKINKIIQNANFFYKNDGQTSENTNEKKDG